MAKKYTRYRELLRIAKAVEEARSEIDLQDLVDPERKMNAGDGVKFWEAIASLFTPPSRVVRSAGRPLRCTTYES